MGALTVSSGMYMVNEHKPDHSNKVFKEKIFNGSYGLYISRRILDENEQLQNTAYYQLITTKKTKTFLNPKKLRRITKVISSFIREKNKPVILIDGIEYLMLMNDYPKVLSFLHKVKEIAETQSATCIIPIDMSTLKNNESDKIEKEFELISSNKH